MDFVRRVVVTVPARSRFQWTFQKLKNLFPAVLDVSLKLNADIEKTGRRRFHPNCFAFVHTRNSTGRGGCLLRREVLHLQPSIGGREIPSKTAEIALSG